MFECSMCHVVKEDSERPKRSGKCRSCQKLYLRAYRLENKERLDALRLEWQRNNKERCAALSKKWLSDPVVAETQRQRRREWKKLNPDKVIAIRENYAPVARAKKQEWRQNNRDKYNAHTREWRATKRKEDEGFDEACRIRARHQQALRRAAKASALAVNYKDELKQIYAQCPEGHEVDHIHPLLGENFSGLHVPWNLQYLPMRENRSKSNKLRSAE